MIWDDLGQHVWDVRWDSWTAGINGPPSAHGLSSQAYTQHDWSWFQERESPRCKGSSDLVFKVKWHSFYGILLANPSPNTSTYLRHGEINPTSWCKICKILWASYSIYHRNSWSNKIRSQDTLLLRRASDCWSRLTLALRARVIDMLSIDEIKQRIFTCILDKESWFSSQIHYYKALAYSTMTSSLK